MKNLSKNNNDEYAVWDKGHFIKYEKVVLHDNGVMVLESMLPIINKIIEEAKKDKISLTYAAAFRTWEKQYSLRVQNSIIKVDKFKTEKEWDDHIKTAPSSYFSPLTAKPGYSNHQDGSAVDFNVTSKPDNYKWLVKNAFKFGWIRTVPSEKWHWEWRSNEKNMFILIPKDHPTWENLV